MLYLYVTFKGRYKIVYLKRMLSDMALKASGQFPAMLVTGPRQSGKTTFLRSEFHDSAYISLDDPLERRFAEEDPNGFLDRFAGKQSTIDEIQYAPTIFPYLKIRIDNDRKSSGKWLLTGSQRFQMMANVSESLAGRIAILDLLPFNYLEYGYDKQLPVGDAVYYGGYPEVSLNPDIRNQWLSSYIQTYIERDIRHITSVQDLGLFQTFLSYCASIHGQELNLAKISSQCGVSQPTCKRWISILETTFIIYLLNPYSRNLGKRLVKSPKLYFIDPAIPAYLTRQSSPDSILTGAMGGAFFEGFIISETNKILTAKNSNASLSFFRSNDQTEIDLIIEKDGTIWPIEIKKSSTPTVKFTESLIKFRALHHQSQKVGTPKLVCTIDEKRAMPHHVEALPWQEYLFWVNEL